MANMLMIVGGIFLGVILIVGIVVLIVKLKSGKKFPFLLYSRDGKHADTIYGRVKTDPMNRDNKRFFFKELDQPLEIRPPSIFINNKPFREITFDNLSEYKYLKNNGMLRPDLTDEEKKKLEAKSIKVAKYIKGTLTDTDYYKSKSLIPEEKQLALFRYKESSIEYQNPINKHQAYIMIGMFIMVLIIGMGVIYSTVAYVKFGKTIVDIEKTSNKNIDTLLKIVERQERIAEYQNEILAQTTGNAEITRQLT